jgi:hypothetical protein
LANTWYTGANVPGKARGVMPYTGGVGPYRGICNEVVSRGMLGFSLAGPNVQRQCNDGEIVRLQPDVRLVLNMMADMKLPPIESLGAQGARAFATQLNAARPAGRPVGEVVDSTLQGADGSLPYRLYRPATPGPHPIVVYFHGGGWVLGDQQSDDPFCRDMCRRTGMLFVSVGYRHAPEHRFPTAAKTAVAATLDITGVSGQTSMAVRCAALPDCQQRTGRVGPGLRARDPGGSTSAAVHSTAAQGGAHRS